MAVLLSDETWLRIANMLADYDAGVLRVIPGDGLKIEEQTSVKANCPGTKIGFIDKISPTRTTTRDINVCIDGSPQTVRFVVVET